MVFCWAVLMPTLDHGQLLGTVTASTIFKEVIHIKDKSSVLH